MDPRLMQLMGGAGKSAPMPQVPQGGQAPGPAGAPMSTPQPAEGEKKNAMVTVSMAMDLLAHAIPGLGHSTEEGQAVIDSLSKLGKKFGTERTKSKDLVPAELMQLMGALPQAGGMSPQGAAMQAAPQPH